MGGKVGSGGLPRGQTSEHTREIARGLHRSIRKTLHVTVARAASSCELEAKFSCYLKFAEYPCFSVVLAGSLHFPIFVYICLSALE